MIPRLSKRIEQAHKTNYVFHNSQSEQTNLKYIEVSSKKYNKNFKNPSTILKFNSLRPNSKEFVKHPTEKGNSYYFESEVSQLKYEFRRIGSYDFTKKEKKKIEPISDCNKHIVANAIKSDSHLVRTVIDDIWNKINELVDAVNLLLDKSTES